MKYTFVLFALLVGLSSCSNNLKYFTSDLYNEYNWSDQELRRIQFYVSEDILLYRSRAGHATNIESGKIKINSDREVEEVIIKKGTPGIFMKEPKTHRFAISFDDEGQFLMFGPSRRTNGRFVLLAKDWDSDLGEVTYGGETYFTSSRSAYAALMVDIDSARRTKYDKDQASGRRVSH